MSAVERAVKAAKAWIKTYTEERDLDDPTNAEGPAPFVSNTYGDFLEVSHVPVHDVDHLVWFVESEADVCIRTRVPEDRWFTKWTLCIRES